ncbi:unnamed protein product, partial [Rotaria socialis]
MNSVHWQQSKFLKSKDLNGVQILARKILDHGYTHCFILTFTSEQDRDTYIDHADHVAYVAMLQPHMA